MILLLLFPIFLLHPKFALLLLAETPPNELSEAEIKSFLEDFKAWTNWKATLAKENWEEGDWRRELLAKSGIFDEKRGGGLDARIAGRIGMRAGMAVRDRRILSNVVEFLVKILVAEWNCEGKGSGRRRRKKPPEFIARCKKWGKVAKTVFHYGIFTVTIFGGNLWLVGSRDPGGGRIRVNEYFVEHFGIKPKLMVGNGEELTFAEALEKVPKVYAQIHLEDDTTELDDIEMENVQLVEQVDAWREVYTRLANLPKKRGKLRQSLRPPLRFIYGGRRIVESREDFVEMQAELNEEFERNLVKPDIVMGRAEWAKEAPRMEYCHEKQYEMAKKCGMNLVKRWKKALKEFGKKDPGEKTELREIWKKGDLRRADRHLKEIVKGHISVIEKSLGKWKCAAYGEGEGRVFGEPEVAKWKREMRTEEMRRRGAEEEEEEEFLSAKGDDSEEDGDLPTNE